MRQETPYPSRFINEDIEEEEQHPKRNIPLVRNGDQTTSSQSSHDHRTQQSQSLAQSLKAKGKIVALIEPLERIDKQ